jgi:hypothetical protein
MPLYKVEYKGKTYKLETDKPAPTEKELEAIIEAAKMNKKTGFVKKAAGKFQNAVDSGFTHKALEGLSLDYADVLFGAGAAEGAGIYDALHLKNPINRQNYEIGAQERKRFNEISNDYQKEHPKKSIIAELVGGIPLAATVPLGAMAKVAKGAPIVAKMAQGAKAGLKGGAIFGGAYGIGKGLTENDNLLSADARRNTALGLVTATLGGTALGGILGGLTPAAMSGLSQAGSKAYNLFSKSGRFNRFLKKIGLENVNSSVDKNVPLLDTANEKVMELAEGSRLNNTQARQIYKDYGKLRKSQQVEKVNNLIDNNFGKKGAQETLDEIEKNAHKKFDYLYEKTMSNGRVPQVNGEILDSLGQTSKSALSPYVKSVINKIKKNKLYYDFAELPDDDIRILDLAKQAIDDEITKYSNWGDKLDVSMLLNEKKNLLNAIDSHIPIYAKARQAFMNMKELETALNQGRKFNRMSREEISNYAKTLTPENKEAFYSGIRETLLKSLDDGAKSEGVNVARRVFDDSVLRKLEGLGIDNFTNLKTQALSERGAVENVNRLLTGSQTAEREANKISNKINPLKLAKMGIDKLYRKTMGLGNEEIAKYLTSPQALKEALKKQGSRVKIDNWLRRSAETLANDSGIEGADKTKFIRKYVTDWYKNNLQGKKFLNNDLDDIGFYTAKGREEVRTDPGRDLLPYTPEIIEKGKTSPAIARKHSSNNNDYESFRNITYPIEYNGRNYEGIVTLGKVKSSNRKSPYNEKNPSSYPGSARAQGALDSILNNPEISRANYSQGYRFYTTYPQEYGGLKNLYHNPQDSGYILGRMFGGQGKEAFEESAAAFERQELLKLLRGEK